MIRSQPESLITEQESVSVYSSNLWTAIALLSMNLMMLSSKVAGPEEKQRKTSRGDRRRCRRRRLLKTSVNSMMNTVIMEDNRCYLIIKDSVLGNCSLIGKFIISLALL